jgi:serine/threonine-protein kinase
MSDDRHSGTISISKLERVDQVCDRFEVAWRNGRRPLLEEYLDVFHELERPVLFRELLVVELQLRRGTGERPDPAEYLSRFTPFAKEIDRAFTLAAPSLDSTDPSLDETRSLPSNDTRTLERVTPDFETPDFRVTDLPVPSSDRALPQIDGYEILGLLGRGGMGVVYRARQVGLDRLAALKMLLAGAHARPEELARFRAEALAVARIKHENIVEIYQVGEHDGLPFFSLEFVAGGTLGQKIAGAPQPLAESAHMVETLARAMHVAHGLGIIHRDLKPANVLLTPDGTPKIADFGLARRLETDSGETSSGMILGTPTYMAPEQARGTTKAAGPQADQYSLGAMLYTMLSGRPPFQGTTVVETLALVCGEEPVPLSRLLGKMPRDLETICLKCLEKDPDNRYPDCATLADDLRRFQEGRPIWARPVSAPERAWRWCLRNRNVAALLATVFSLLTALGGISFVASLMLASEQARTETQRKQAVAAKDLAEKNAVAEKAARGQAEANHRLASDQARAAIDTIRELTTKVDNTLGDRASVQPVRRTILAVASTNLRKVAKIGDDARLVDRTLARIHQLMGDLARSVGNSTEALAEYQQAFAIVQAVAKAAPGDPTTPRNLAAARNNLGDLYLNHRDDPATARQLYTEALADRKAWHAFYPDNDETRTALATQYALLAITSLRQGNPAQARSELEESARWRDQVSEPTRKSPGFRRDQAGLFDRLGEAALKLGDPEAARQHYQKALEIRETLAREAPDQNGPGRDLALSLNHLGSLNLFLEGDAAVAQGLFTRALQILRSPPTFEPDSAFVQSYLGLTLYHLGAACVRRGDHAAARGHFQSALEVRRKLLNDDREDTQLQRQYVVALGRCGRHADAVRNAEILRRKSRKDPGTLYHVATAYAVCAGAVVEDQGQSKDKDKAPGLARRYADQAIDTLREAVKLGWRDLVSIQTDPDFDAIESDPGFARLIDELKSMGLPHLQRP